jgi:hypothetical protein
MKEYGESPGRIVVRRFLHVRPNTHSGFPEIVVKIHLKIKSSMAA